MNVIDKHIADYLHVLQENTGVLSQFKQSADERHNLGFNVFTLVSDLYYRENFHSDVLRVFLDPSESHDEGDSFLKAFIQMVNKGAELQGKPQINWKDYSSITVHREQARLDVSVFNNYHKEAIIIENKLYDAGDMNRQIPRYVEEVEQNNRFGEGYKVVSVVYVPLSRTKELSHHGWSVKDHENYDKLVVQIPSTDGNNADLIDWLDWSIEESKIETVKQTLVQYKRLINHLARLNMNKPLMDKLFDGLSKEGGMSAARSLYSMLEQYGSYSAERLEKRFSDVNFDPFELWIYKNNTTVLSKLFIGEHEIVIDIACSKDGYDLYFFDRKAVDSENLVRTKFSVFCSQNGLQECQDGPNKTRFQKWFDMNDEPAKTEEDVVNFVQKIIEEVKRAI